MSSSTTCPISFNKLLAEYTPGGYLVETKQGLEFRKEGPRIIRCLDHLFLGTSYNLEKNTHLLIQRAKTFLDQKDPTIKELEGLTKILFLTKRILWGASLFQRKPYSLYSEEKTIALRALQLLAKKKELSELQLCLELGKDHLFFLEEAYRKSAKGDLLKTLSKEQLDLFISYAQKKEDIPLILQLIALGGKSPLFSKEIQRKFLKKALSEYNERLLSALIRNDYDCNFTCQDSKTHFVLACIEQGMSEAIKAMIEKNVSFSITDSEGNSPLHYAFLIGNSEIAAMLLKIVDPTAKNKAEETPLSCLLRPSTEKTQTLFLNNRDIGKFLKDTFPKKTCQILIKNHSYRDRKNTHISKDLSSIWNDIELSFLLGNTSLTDSMFQHIRRTTFEKGCADLQIKYPKESVEAFFISSFSLQEEHYKTGTDVINLPQEDIGNPNPAELLDLFDELKTLPRSDRRRLEDFLETIRIKKVFTATPKAGTEALILFYNRIERNLKHIVFSLKKKQDPLLTERTLKEFILASGLCGAKYNAVAQQEAQRVCLGLGQSSKDIFERSLAEFRAVCFNDLIARVYSRHAHNVHCYNYAFLDFAKMFGLPGCNEELPFEDGYERENYLGEKYKILPTFKKDYTTISIIYNWILPQLKEEIQFRNGYIDLQKEHMPSSWVVQNSEGIPTEEEKVQDFLGKVVYDESFQLQASGVRFLLERLGIIACKMKE